MKEGQRAYSRGRQIWDAIEERETQLRNLERILRWGDGPDQQEGQKSWSL